MINVKDEGIIGDGITDFTVHINELFIQNAGETIFFPSGEYLIKLDHSGIRPQSGTTILMSAGTILKAIPTERNNYAIIICAQVEDINIIGGTIVGERARHLDQEGARAGACIKVYGAQNVNIKNVMTSNAWGDGIFVGSDIVGTPARRVTVEQVFSYGNTRAGLVGTYFSGLHVKDSSFCGNNSPKAISNAWGISIEPDAIGEISSGDLVIERVVCAHNETDGINVSAYHAPINGLKIDEAHLYMNGGCGLYLKDEINDLILGKLDIHDNLNGDIRCRDLNSVFSP